MRILIDADACPVVDETIAVAKRYHTEVIIFCDIAHEIKRKDIEVVVLDTGNDNVDYAIVGEVKTGDLVITQDYGLASLVLAKGGQALNQDGMAYTNENIDILLGRRHLYAKMRKAGVRTPNASKRTMQQNEQFCKVLEKQLKFLNGKED